MSKKDKSKVMRVPSSVYDAINRKRGKRSFGETLNDLLNSEPQEGKCVYYANGQLFEGFSKAQMLHIAQVLKEQPRVLWDFDDAIEEPSL